MITGSCLCGAVRFQITGKIGPVGYCHCGQCRKASGTAFAANADVRRDEMTFDSGLDDVREYESSRGNFRAFCWRCGSPVYSRTSANADRLRVRLGLLDDDPGRRGLVHCWVSSKAPWYEIADQLPQFEEGPPPRPPRAR
jgi:hypothetical protein